MTVPHLALPHLAGRIFGRPLAVARPKLDLLLQVLEPRFLGQTTGVAALAAGDDDDDDAGLATSGPVAVIPVMGTLVQRAAGIQALSGLAGYQRLSAQLTNALDDDDVSSILLHIDSPGGEVSGLFTLVDQIQAARQQKPVWAFVDEEALSAGYAIASAAERIYLPETARVGSVGVVAAHLDQSKSDAMAGLTYTFISAGNKKADGNSHQPLSGSALRDTQAEVDRIHELFTGTVARSRGLSQDAVKATEAGIMPAPQAIADGYADGIATIDQVISMMAQQAAAAATTTGSQAAATNRRLLMTTTDNQPGTGGEVVSLDAVRAEARSEGSKTALAEAGQIVAECNAAGAPQLAARYFDGSLTAQQVRQRLAEAPEINRLCSRAKMPELAAGMISRGLSAGDASRELVDKIADADTGEIDGTISPDARVQGASVGSKLVEQAKKMAETHAAKRRV